MICYSIWTRWGRYLKAGGSGDEHSPWVGVGALEPASPDTTTRPPGWQSRESGSDGRLPSGAAGPAIDKQQQQQQPTLGHPPGPPHHPPAPAAAHHQPRMISSLPLSSAHVHKPLIRFLGKRVFNTPAPVATFHPLAPEDIKSKFSEFLHHRQHPSQSVRAQDQDPGRSGSSKENVIWYDDPSQLPWKYITPTQNEIDLINGGGVIQ